jgi:protein-tyrosine phosphatase
MTEDTEAAEAMVNTLLLEATPSVSFRVLGDLWIGSAPPIGWTVGQHFDCLVLSAMEYPPGPSCFPKVETIAVSMNDDGTPMRRQEMAEAVRAAGRVLSWLKARKRVLVTCHAGLNRSGLVLALILIKDGLTPQDAIARIRDHRGEDALFNRDFHNWLLTEGESFFSPSSQQAA